MVMVSVDANAGGVRQPHVGKFGPKSLLIPVTLLVAFGCLKSLWQTVLYVQYEATVRSPKNDFFSLSADLANGCVRRSCC